MANNRIYLRCRKCGAILYLGKCFDDGYYYRNGSVPLQEELNEFYDKHAFCTEPLDTESIEYIDTPFKQVDSYYNRFEIAYEMEDEDEVVENE